MAFQPGALSGTAFLTIDGLEFPVVSGVGYQVSRVTRETLTGQSGVHGFSEKPVAPYIKATIRDIAEISIAGFEAMTDVSVSLELASGKRISGNGMWNVGAVEVNSDEATYDLRFDGLDVQET
ncbi:phage tail tube protein [Roseomonas xinghualingensis]|uniref:phage tail tube protein n=1 Tax=Roseomonas xinghualingensis TaxID=2986475 RepID=UPI0021F1062F|nr:phage tail tube protein [Roseomonas sp. SXEYE001]MCV4206920.1 phage tail tube protein [Roseomonas sp. SXEYE001]